MTADEFAEELPSLACPPLTPPYHTSPPKPGEQQVVQLSARAGVARPQLPNDNEIRRVGYAAHQALRKVADNADAEQLATDFLRVFEALVVAAKR